MDAPPRSTTNMDYDHRDAWSTIAAAAVAMAALVGGLLGGLQGWSMVTVGWAGPLVAGAVAVWLLVGPIRGFAAETAGLRDAAARVEQAQHDRSHPGGVARRGWLVARMARLRCRSGHGHCVHPRSGEDPMTDPVFTDSGVDHVDRGGWCCQCPAQWRFTPIPVPPCRVCDGHRRGTTTDAPHTST